ncbi:serine kinase, partial [Mesorhizobium sp. M7A.T.Ca.TU.009.01.1.1]
MPNVTLENLVDYARHVLAQAESSAAHYPLTREAGLPHLDLTAHVSPGALADAVAHGFVSAPGNRTPADICR